MSSLIGYPIPSGQSQTHMNNTVDFVGCVCVYKIIEEEVTSLGGVGQTRWEMEWGEGVVGLYKYSSCV